MYLWPVNYRNPRNPLQEITHPGAAAGAMKGWKSGEGFLPYAMAKNKPSHVSRPVYPGGLTAMKKFVSGHLKYPKEALSEKVEGTVIIRYALDYRGKVVDAKVKKGLGHGCDEEALRVVKMLRFEVPQERKKKVRINQDINIHFKLPKPRKKTSTAPAAAPSKQLAQVSATSVRYTSVPASGKVAGKVIKPTKKPAAGGSYTYTVTIK